MPAVAALMLRCGSWGSQCSTLCVQRASKAQGPAAAGPPVLQQPHSAHQAATNTLASDAKAPSTLWSEVPPWHFSPPDSSLDSAVPPLVSTTPASIMHRAAQPVIPQGLDIAPQQQSSPMLCQPPIAPCCVSHPSQQQSSPTLCQPPITAAGQPHAVSDPHTPVLCQHPLQQQSSPMRRHHTHLCTPGPAPAR